MYTTKISSDVSLDKKTGKASGDLKVSVNGYSRRFSGEIKDYKEKAQKEPPGEYSKVDCAKLFRTMRGYMSNWSRLLRNL
jgi:uncharacterized protein YjbJ (UPF0337 family)